MNRKYDHIVVGAGSAGSVLAARLSEDRHRSVLLLEAGGDYPALERMPDSLKYAYGTGEAIWDSGHIWNFRARATDQARIDVPRGKVTGGSSSVNDAQFLRGMPEDFDRWAEWGNSEWQYEKLLPYLRKLEADQDFADESHGTDGPISCRRYQPGEWGPQQHAFYRACRDAGFPDCPDHNQAGSTGVGPLAFNISGRVRVSTAMAYLDPARHRAGLTIRPHCHVVGIILKGRRAIGLQVSAGDEDFFRLWRGDHPLCRRHRDAAYPCSVRYWSRGPLRQLDIPVVCDLPGVGRNLRDHPDVPMAWRTRVGFPLNTDQVATGTVTLRFTASGSSFKNDLVIYMGNYAAAKPMRGLDHRNPIGIGVSLCLYLAFSQGELRLQSSDPRQPPYLDFNLLDDPSDRSRLRECVRVCADLFRREAFDQIVEERLAPSDDVLSDDDALDTWMKREVITAHHVSSTCKMGSSDDPMAVVDQYGRVYGIDGLRVIDASIMPDTVRANLNLTVIAMAERAADLIKGG